MALPESELPQWPRPRPAPALRPRILHPDFGEEREDDKIQQPDLRQHPLGQRPQATSLRPALLLLVLFSIGSYWSWMHPDVNHLAATQRAVFEEGQIWRLMSTLWVHADIAHLLANSGLFLIFGLFLRNYFGLWAFPGLSVLGGMLTGALALLTYGPETRLIGASGMVYFMAALWLFLFLRHADYLSWTHRVMRAIAFSLVVLVPTQFEPQVSYRTHAIGFALGLFFGWLSAPWMKPVTAPPSYASIHHEDVEYQLSPTDVEEDLLP
ncbi:MAG TPA: rhomboid family intramembrane serine protease [Oligoflexus sp.]|uniref:rhomboid family intramembrane serine protease n=1 Tax=Oligoflexus sp. TaxID=1971216 RepID=UPI002D602F2E|nr:rhomboid family intramembrane serine protease [Oligoflexus sp.]HYX34727.1 rhomboid family intramembrane serine protease [Oligoflexus sp.]